MNIDTNALFALPAVEKLQLVELLWDNLGESETLLPLPEWVEREAIRRRDEMLADPELGRGHQETWARIEKRRGH